MAPDLALATLGGKPLDVIAVVSNPARYESRYRLYREFAARMATAGVRLTTVESALGDRPFVVTDGADPRHVQVRRDDEVWDKEALANVGISRLPADWQYVAWVDADVAFARPDWALETLHQLQVHPVVQLFSEAIDLGPRGEVVERHRGFAAQAAAHRRHCPDYNQYAFWHPGFAWAIARWALEELGSLLDAAILGAGDHHMATALRGDVLASVHGGASAGYKAACLAWQARAARLKGDLGHVDGTLLHHWHGPKKSRGYQTRWRVLIDHGFDPATDLVRDHQGLWRLAGNKPGLRDGIRDYFRSRNEDSIDPARPEPRETDR